jgi:hypothetical protein
MNDVLIAVLCLSGCVFGTSACVKLRGRSAYRAFRAGLGETSLVPDRLLPVVAPALGVGEAVVAAALVAAVAATVVAAPGAPALACCALAAAAALIATLVAGVGAVIRRGTPARCACFGTGSDRPLSWVHLARNLSLLIVVTAGLAVLPLSTGHATATSASLAGAGLAAATGAAASVLFMRWEDLADLFIPLAQRPDGTTAIRGRR